MTEVVGADFAPTAKIGILIGFADPKEPTIAGKSGVTSRLKSNAGAIGFGVTLSTKRGLIELDQRRSSHFSNRCLRMGTTTPKGFEPLVLCHKHSLWIFPKV
jgi:hypothetical protein